MKLFFTKIIAIVAMITLFVTCDDAPETKSDKKEITTFTINGTLASIDEIASPKTKLHHQRRLR